MKKTVKISISGVAFDIETDAYELLKNYLSTLEEMYRDNPDGREITGDIEARIAELILSWQQEGSTPVTEACIRHIVEQLGLPDSAGEAVGTEEYAAVPPAPSHPSDRLTRRLYRNPDGAVVLGVFSGVATYFGIDPVWLRAVILSVLAVFVFFTHTPQALGYACLVYLGLGFIIPKAKSPRQKLEMEGRPITVSSLESRIREDMDSLSDNPRNRRSASLFASLLYALGNVIRVFLIVIAAILAVSLVIAVFSVLVFAVIFYVKWSSSLPLLTDFPPFWGTLLLAVGALAPLVFIIYLLAKMIFGIKRLNRPFLFSLLGVWIVSWLFAAIVITMGLSENNTRSESSKTERLSLAADTLYVRSLSGTYPVIQYDFMEVGPEEAFYQRIPLLVETSTDGTAYLELERESRGRNGGDARRNAERIEVKYRLEGDTLFIDPYFAIDREMKFHKQRARLYFYLPANVKVIPDDPVHRFSPIRDRRPRPEAEGDSEEKEMRIEARNEEGSARIVVQKDSSRVVITADKNGGTVKREVIDL